MCFRYSLSVVAPMQRSSPRARAGLSMLLASMAPSLAPAPTRVCSSSMNRITPPWAFFDLFDHGFEPLFELTAIFRTCEHRAEIEREQTLVFQALRHVTRGDALAQALDDRGLADTGVTWLISTGLFFVRRESTCITRRISSSRPTTGSILPALGGPW